MEYAQVEYDQVSWACCPGEGVCDLATGVYEWGGEEYDRRWRG